MSSIEPFLVNSARNAAAGLFEEVAEFPSQRRLDPSQLGLWRSENLRQPKFTLVGLYLFFCLG